MLILAQANRLAFDALPHAKSLGEELTELVEFLHDTDAARPVYEPHWCLGLTPLPTHPRGLRNTPSGRPASGQPNPHPTLTPKLLASPDHPSCKDHAPNPYNQACPTNYAPLRAARGEEPEGGGGEEPEGGGDEIGIGNNSNDDTERMSKSGDEEGNGEDY